VLHPPPPPVILIYGTGGDTGSLRNGGIVVEKGLFPDWEPLATILDADVPLLVGSGNSTDISC